nr:hypothetical protein [Baekduia sp.]
TLSDPSAPTLGSIGGDFSSPQVLTSRPAFTIAGTDNSGIRAARLYVDGTLVDEHLSSCSYDRPRPCTDLTVSQPLGFDPATVADGDHQLKLAVVDAAGNETRTSPVTRIVDGTPPAAPQLTVTSPAVNNSTVDWQPAPAGAVGTASSEWRVCRYEGQECGQWTAVATAAGSITQGVYAPRLSVHVRNTDELGRTGPEAVADLPWTYIPGATTTTPPNTTTTTSTATTPIVPVARKTTKLKLTKAKGSGKRIVALGGTVSIKSARISVTLTRKGHKRIARTLRAKSGKFTLRVGHVPRGRWKLTLRYAGSSTTKPASTTRTITVR